MNQAYDMLISRRSVRKFLPDPVSRDLIEKIISAGHRAATARNVQPWLFIAVTDAAGRKAIKDQCPQNGPYIEIAPVCICVFCEDTKYYLEDGSAATQNILNAAHALGLAAVWVAGDKKDYADKIRQLLALPEKYKLVSLIPVGYPDGNTPLTSRKPLAAVMRWEQYSA